MKRFFKALAFASACLGGAALFVTGLAYHPLVTIGSVVFYLAFAVAYTVLEEAK